MEHEYALIGGMNRSQVGRYISLVAAAISAACVFVVLSLVDLAKTFGVNATIPPSLLSLLGAGAVFSALYWFFNRFAWRWAPVGKLLRVPDLSGCWECEGETLNPDGSTKQRWTGQITILQSWDKLRVHLRTTSSGSDSINAALISDPVQGYILLYHYKNQPRIGEADLRPHRGCAELAFAPDRLSASGEYFNGYGRDTFGRLQLKKAQ
ncbi:hypothetical protein [Rhizobium leguminosarum]|uniref:Cap15 family cyclic dinucleotide receptor domain-containing protein n=1 Tax=Rhizobium leguminosarum TaxID=384 RepID=UPI001C97F777|nr:hypothetical protein [Rhizobium leguminosarum]MBY5658495.1 hypothetical protein [Rhizobium leguminosarum]